MKVTIDLDKYPLFQDLEDPEGMITTIIRKEYEIFKAQKESYGNIEMLKMITETCDRIEDEYSRKMEGVIKTK